MILSVPSHITEAHMVYLEFPKNFVDSCEDGVDKLRSVADKAWEVTLVFPDRQIHVDCKTFHDLMAELKNKYGQKRPGGGHYFAPFIAWPPSDAQTNYFMQHYKVSIPSN